MHESTGRLVWAYAVIDSAGRQPDLTRLPRVADGAGPPRLISFGGRLALIVADVPRATFDAPRLEARLKDADWVACRAAAHHRVIERVARRRAVVPLRVFTIFASDARARQAMGASSRRLASALARVRNRAEWVVRVFRPPRRVRGSMPASRAASGTAFLRARARQHLAERDGARQLAEGAVALAEGVAEVADARATRPVDPGDEAMIDAAFLVATGRLAAFRRRLTTLSRSLRQQGCRIVVTGPWPPYSFVGPHVRGDA